MRLSWQDIACLVLACQFRCMQPCYGLKCFLHLNDNQWRDFGSNIAFSAHQRQTTELSLQLLQSVKTQHKNFVML